MRLMYLLIPCLFTYDAFARCAGGTLESDFKRAEIVVVAKAVNSTDLSTLGNPKCGPVSSGAESICTYQAGPIASLVSIDEVIKGNAELGKRAFILQENTIESISIEKGNRYLLFAKRIGEELYVSPACSGSFDVDGAEKTLAAVRAMAKSKSKKY